MDMSKELIYEFHIRLGTISVMAATLREARKKAADKLDNLAGSNDGTERLANADLELKRSYTCNHELSEPEVNMYQFTDGKHQRVITRVWCTKCDMLVSETDVKEAKP